MKRTSADTQNWRERWRVFGPLWLVFAAGPILGMTVETFGYGRAFFWLYLPVFVLAFFVAAQRAHLHRIPRAQIILLGTLVPFFMAVLAGGLWHLTAVVIRLAVD